jgi:peptidoglycan L-alanyl-D-glutamate endopeptidase CwlK
MHPLHPDARRVLDQFIQLTPHDCTVLEVSRSVTRQAQLVQSGASRTMNSRHIPNHKGVVHAWDLGVMVGGKTVWTWDLYEEIADTMKKAAIQCAVPIRWGGSWEVLNHIDGSCGDAVDDYVARCRLLGSKPFLDGGHFELPETLYK